MTKNEIADQTNAKIKKIFRQISTNYKEVLVAKNTKFRIISISTDEDYEEIGYYHIDVEYLN